MMKIVAIRDVKAGVYGVPAFVSTLGGAMRSFGDEIAKQDGNPFSLHPADYEMYEIGVYHEETAKFELLPSPNFMVSGTAFVK